MMRALYTLAMVGLIGGTAWTAGGIPTDRPERGAGMGVVLIAALQR